MFAPAPKDWRSLVFEDHLCERIFTIGEETYQGLHEDTTTIQQA